MSFLNTTFFWIILFVIQVFLLSKISSNLFNYLYVYFHKIFKKDSTVVFVISMMFLPGTFIHELSHAITATLLGSRVTRFSIWPKVENGGIKMGYAEFIVKDIFRNTLIGISPLIFGIFILYFLITNFFNFNLAIQLLFIYIIFQVSNSMFLSESDIKDLKILAAIFIFLFLVILLSDYFYFKINLFQDMSFLSSLDSWFTFFYFLNIFFFFTMIMNFLILILVKYLNKFHIY